MKEIKMLSESRHPQNASRGPAQIVRLPTNHQVGCANCPLKQFCLPDNLNEAEQKKLEDIIEQTKTLHKNQFLFRQGDAFDEVYLVKSGSFKSYQVSADGEEQITGFYMPGDIIGLESVHDGTHMSSAKALETGATCSISFNRLTVLAAKIPHLQKHLFDLMSKGLQSDRKLLMLLSKKGAVERIAAFLLTISQHLKKRKLSDCHFTLPMSRADIGNYLGLAIETVSRVFTKLQKQGVIECKNRELSINDLYELQVLAGQEKAIEPLAKTQ